MEKGESLGGESCRMLTRYNVAAASTICLLSWALIFGLAADVDSQGHYNPTTLIIFGRAGPIAQDQTSGESLLMMDDGARDWVLTIPDGVQRPETGSQILAICSLRPGAPPTIVRILYPWSQNVF